MATGYEGDGHEIEVGAGGTLDGVTLWAQRGITFSPDEARKLAASLVNCADYAEELARRAAEDAR